MIDKETPTPQTEQFDYEKLDSNIESLTTGVPGIVSATNPDLETKQLVIDRFLANEIENPDFSYSKIEKVTTDTVASVRDRAEAVLLQGGIPQDWEEPYQAFVKGKALQAELMDAMRRYNQAESDADKEAAQADFMKLNIEQYGEPDETTYRSLLSEKIQKISHKSRSASAERVYQDLLRALPEGSRSLDSAPERFRPSSETVAWMNQVVEALYGGMLRHVPEGRDDIQPEELRQIFQTIIDEEFGEVASDWSATSNDAAAISVSPGGKRVNVPPTRAAVDTNEAKRLVVHEIGVHMLRAITGASTDMPLLRKGLYDYYESEEGLGKVMEQALEGEFREAGIDHYITAGLAYFDSCDFRKAFEIKWRMKLLEDLDDGQEATEADIAVARKEAFGGKGIATTRIFRGTDELPLFKDLAYYNGSVEIWKYLEKIRGDDLQLSLLLAGKVGASREHQRTVLESRTVN